MTTSTIPISESSHQILGELVGKTGMPAMEILDKALDAYRRQLFFDKMNAGYAALRADPVAWAESESERQAWDATLMDGLDPQEKWTPDGRCTSSDENQG